MLTQSSESSERASAASRKQDGQEVHDGQEGSPSPTAKPAQWKQIGARSVRRKETG